MRRFIHNRLITHPRKDGLSGEGGMTMLEVMIALVILAVGLLAVSGMQIMSIKGTGSGYKFTRAAALADQGIVNLASLSFSDPQLDPTTFPLPDYTDPYTNVVYSLRYRVDDVQPIVGVKLITYTVTWDNGAHSISLVERVGNDLL
jgi:prepilin-type N-terminal cleavage/methylation domain-containing protein